MLSGTTGDDGITSTLLSSCLRLMFTLSCQSVLFPLKLVWGVWLTLIHYYGPCKKYHNILC